MNMSSDHLPGCPLQRRMKSNKHVAFYLKRQGLRPYCVKRGAAAHTLTMEPNSNILPDTPSAMWTAPLPVMPLMVRWLLRFPNISRSRSPSAWPTLPERCVSHSPEHRTLYLGVKIWKCSYKPKNELNRIDNETSTFGGISWNQQTIRRRCRP